MTLPLNNHHNLPSNQIVFVDMIPYSYNIKCRWNANPLNPYEFEYREVKNDYFGFFFYYCDNDEEGEEEHL